MHGDRNEINLINICNNLGFGFKLSQKTFLAGVLLLSSFIILSSYKATLNSMLILPKVKVPFTNVQEMVHQNQVKWYLVQKTVMLRIAKVRYFDKEFIEER